MDNDKKNSNWLKPVMLFYGKTTSWVVFPLVIALVASKFTESSGLFFVFLIIGFGITCFGIYREIKEYKKTLQDGNK